MSFAKNSFFRLTFLLILKVEIRVSRQVKSLQTFDVNVMDLSVDDILNADLIPVQIVTEQLKHFFNHNNTGYDGRHLVNSPEQSCLNCSDLNAAVGTMRYHRHMMNEYLISSYLSNEILSSTMGISNFYEPSIGKRSGKAKSSPHTSNLDTKSDNQSLPSNHKLIEDEGSSQYSIWLKRMKTFEDIQKQLFNKKLLNPGVKNKHSANRRQSFNINLEPAYDDVDTDEGSENIEDGDITGYALTNTPTENTAVWCDQKKYVRHKAAQNLRFSKGTGGGPNMERTFSATEEAIYHLIGMKESVEGVALTFGLGTSNTIKQVEEIYENEEFLIEEDVTSDPEVNQTPPAKKIRKSIEMPTQNPAPQTPLTKKVKKIFEPPTHAASSDVLVEEINIQKQMLEVMKEQQINCKKIYRSIDRLYDLKKEELQEQRRHNSVMEEFRLKEVEDKIEKNRQLLELEKLKNKHVIEKTAQKK